MSPNARLEIVFFGGEPLLNWPIAKKVILRCENDLKKRHQDKDFRYHITSNLTILPDDLIEWAREYRITFLCNVDGPDYLHDRCRPFKNGRPSHGRTLQNIQRLIASGLPVSLRSTISSINQKGYIPEIAVHHKEIGGASSAIVPIGPVNSDGTFLPDDIFPSPDQVINGLVQVYESRVWESARLFPFSTYSSKVHLGRFIVMGCGAPYGNTSVIDAHGDVYPCSYLVGNKRYHLGNILKRKYLEDGLLGWMIDSLHVDHADECRGCSWRYICGGGCPVWRLNVLGNPVASPRAVEYVREINCEFTKKVLELLLWELAWEAASSFSDGVPKEVAAPSNQVLYC